MLFFSQSCWNGLLEKCKYIGSEDCESLKEREHGLGIMLFQSKCAHDKKGPILKESNFLTRFSPMIT